MSQNLRRPTKKESRELRKKEKLRKNQLAEEQAAKKKRLIRSATIWSGVVVGLIVLVLGMIKITSRAQSGLTWLSDQNFVVNWTKGAKSAQIILVEYSDFQCPACARYSRITKKLIEELGDDFQLNFRHYPLKQHINAELAAKSAEAAGRQGKFWEMHDLLFERQKEWIRNKNKDTEKLFLQYAVSLDLNLEQFKSDLHSQAVTNKVHNDALSGRRSGVKGTPTFFLNGQKIIDNPRNYETFKDLIIKTKSDLS
jgi:protein-disulfide isomerase